MGAAFRTPQSHPAQMGQRTFLVIDFECFRPGEWQSVGAVLVRRGRVVEVFHAACHRADPAAETSVGAFWASHAEAWRYNRAAGLNRGPHSEEIRICEFIQNTKARYPNFHLVSDCPEYDIGIMNTILTRHWYAVMSHRNDRTYFQTVCTWSSRRVLQQLGIPIQANLSIECPRAYPALKHTPVFDCIRTINEYLSILHTLRLCASQNKAC